VLELNLGIPPTGPDAREKRPDMLPMSGGYTIDHQVKSGMLLTLFSAPDYPQFQPGTKRNNNQAAFVVLQADSISTPTFHQFAAVPRPVVQPYYDFENTADSDAEQSR